MTNAKIGETVHVYSMADDGRVLDRLGVVTGASKQNDVVMVRLDGGQIMSLPYNPGRIVKDSMWSTAAKRNVYIEQMLEILMDRQEHYRERLRSTTRKISVMRSCVV